MPPLSQIPTRLRLMAVTALVLAIVLLFRWISDWGLVTVHVSDAPLGKVLDSIARQAHVRLESSADPLKKVTLDVEKVPVAEAMEILSGNSGLVWRRAFLAAPDKTALEAAIISLRAGGTIDGWTIRHYPAPPFLDTGGDVVDPSGIAWTPEGPAMELPGLLDEAAQKTGVMTAWPEAWTPSVPRLPKAGSVRAVVPDLVSSAKGKSLAFLYVGERPQRGPGPGEQPPAEGLSSPVAGSPSGESPRWTGGGGRMSQVRPEWMLQRLTATAATLPAEKRQQALKDVDDLKPVLDQLKTLTPEERRAKMREMMANPAFAEKMADRMLTRDSNRAPAQRITRAVGYINRKASAKASGQ